MCRRPSASGSPGGSCRPALTACLFQFAGAADSRARRFSHGLRFYCTRSSSRCHCRTADEYKVTVVRSCDRRHCAASCSIGPAESPGETGAPWGRTCNGVPGRHTSPPGPYPPDTQLQQRPGQAGLRGNLSCRVQRIGSPGGTIARLSTNRVDPCQRPGASRHRRVSSAQGGHAF